MPEAFGPAAHLIDALVPSGGHLEERALEGARELLALEGGDLTLSAGHVGLVRDEHQRWLKRKVTP